MTKRRKDDKYICKRCLMPVIAWRGGWKHATGGSSGRSCTQPIPVLDQDHTRDLQVAFRNALARGEKD
jgi:hypothetical protein